MVVRCKFRILGLLLGTFHLFLHLNKLGVLRRRLIRHELVVRSLLFG